ncbi:uncharacterized protein LOC129775928 isoform X2 [Toxorhynchites rutilus septentrionalis]|nr:uncharacterized protein LOC129775928 isoform X2 [Toxorhynchites rutilus septentrionalis]XP_055637183.1 uncharacterized protein LOC129775928 isoform X2 [Toxorhynchites rutilus septentrionalis]XP_055637184.1 uncharacterized protein LOC129775928 isoform X2 [Toxorhynchites rutilus septentrionalis]
MTPIHEDDQIVLKKHVIDEQGSVENNEENEVISVRLLNSFQLTPFSSISTEVQNILYENVQETPENNTAQKPINEWNITMVPYDRIKTTMTPSSNNTSPKVVQSITDDSLEHDWVYSRLEIPESTEEPNKSFTTTDAKTWDTSERQISKSTTALVNTSTVRNSHPPEIVVASRKRTARNKNSYHSWQSDLNNINLEDLDYSEVLDEIMQSELSSSSSGAESEEQSDEYTDQPSEEQHNSIGNCRCAEKNRPTKVTKCDHPRSPQHIFRRRLHNRHDGQVVDDSSSPNLSIEHTERMQSAFERFMGLVTIMSHVDSFIQKKAKQSIRRLARLYESNEHI